MARPGLEKHVKFKRLVSMLRMPKPHVRGHLETLWEVAYENGDPVIGDSEAVEAAAEWHGEPGKLFEALLNCGGTGRAGFISLAGPEGHYEIHDLYDHAPEYVKKRRLRELEHKSRNGKARVRPVSAERQTTADNGAPPSTQHPAPNLSSNEERILSCPNERESPASLFARFWTTYPKRAGKKRGREATLNLFRKLNEADQILAITAAENYAKSKDAIAGFARDPTRFLQAGYWKDWLDPEPLFGGSATSQSQVYDPTAKGSF